ncbi:hypothetical protein ACQUSY_00425 [Microbacterium sp. YY-03]|uniref:hypothetical protein n=1 Tax=Microbacterium sp. YY-03 TaxID=3421636 RepID=UPI003D1833D1
MDPFSQFQLAMFAIWLGLFILGLLIAYGVIYFAVRNALRSHARWEYAGGVAGEDRRAIER